ncbi:MAG TPA: trypsin-like peptidase domain-containing protein [Ktedonobacterales bacterium]|nr:trypsin-like peptidase domain-containing protein [Ktedonobacterales bacterium]
MQGTSIPPYPGDSQQPQQPMQAPPPLPAESAPEAAGPTQPAYPGYPQYPGYQQGYQNGYQGNYQGMPPYPPSNFTEGTPPRPRRWGLIAIGAAIMLLLTLAVGIAGGVALSRATASQGSTSGNTVLGSTSAPRVTVSSSTTTLQQDLMNVAKAVAPSVVKITSTGSSGEAIGSGNILTSDGYIVTNDHVVQGFSNYSVQLSTGATYTAQLIGESPDDDLAVIKINATGLTPIAFGDSSTLQVGEFAIAIGNPLNLGESATFGHVSRLNQTASEAPNGPAGTLTGLIQTDAPINPGNSGGALVNLKGQLIGIPTLAAINPESRGTQTSIGFAISSNRVQFVAKQLIEQGKVTSSGRSFIGIEAQDVDPAVAAQLGLSVQSGVLVRSFVNDAAGASPAQQAGLRVNDVITKVNGTAVNNNSDLSGALQNQAPGSKVSLTVVRGSSTLTISVTLGERPASTQG